LQSNKKSKIYRRTECRSISSMLTDLLRTVLVL
jgi:hypothetical protein